MKAYLCTGDLRSVYVRVDLKEVARRGTRWYPELTESDPDARRRAVHAWEPLSLWWLPPDGKEAFFDDVVGFGGIRGFETLVSARARDLLLPYVESECAFLPVEISGAPLRYFVLYVTRLVDCLDKDRSRFGRPAPSLPTPISIPRLREDSVSGYLFRLQGGGGYQFDYDFGTESFVALVRTLGLRGFRFREDPGAKTFQAVD